MAARKNQKPKPLVFPEWQQQPGESARDYGKFRCYVELGPGRTIAEAFRSYSCDFRARVSPKENKERPETRRSPSGPFKMVASKQQWVVRAQAYDAYLQHHFETEHRKSLAAQVARKEKNRETIWRLAERVLAQADTLMYFHPFKRTEVAGPDGNMVLLEPPGDMSHYHAAARLFQVATEALDGIHEGVADDPEKADAKTQEAILRRVLPLGPEAELSEPVD